MMIALLLLLGAFVSKGFSADSSKDVEYGGTYHVQRRRSVVLIEFIPQDSSNLTILWKEGDKMSADRKLKVTGYLSLLDLTQKNSGHYVMRDKYGNVLSRHTLRVRASTNTYYRKRGGHVSFSFDLEPDSCNIYFFPQRRSHQSRVLKEEIVRGGRLYGGLDELDCVGFDLLKPCGISNDALQMSCNGRYEIRDQDDNTALEVSLQMGQVEWAFERKSGESFNFTFDVEPASCNIHFFPEDNFNQPRDMIIVSEGSVQWDLDEYDCTGFDLLRPCGIVTEALQMACSGRYEIIDKHGNTVVVVTLEMNPTPIFEPSHIGIGFGVFLTSLFCYCVKRCCCGKSSSKEETAAEPDVHYHEYDHEPVGPRSDQLREPSGTHYPAPPSYTASVPLIHDHPTVNVPPPYSEVSAPADAPTVPVHADPGPQFEMKGVTFPCAPPLYSDSADCAVYTSDKLNFL